jgi:dihydrofolate synthase/folylpolyglutamate synthase
MGFFSYTYAIFGAMSDKDIAGILAQLKGRIEHWCLTDLPLARAASAQTLKTAVLEAGFYEADAPDAQSSIECFSSPAEALGNASNRAGENDRIVVFGSFWTVAGILAAKKSALH